MIMSTLAQVRIVSLSQRYLTLAAHRYDHREITISHKTGTIGKNRICGLSNRKKESYSDVHQSINLAELPMKHTPTSLFRDRNYINQTGHILNKIRLSYFGSICMSSLKLRTSDDDGQSSLNQLHGEHSCCKKFLLLISNKQNLNIMSSAKDSFFKQNSRARTSCQYHKNGRYSTNSQKTSAHFLAAMLGLLGLFKKTNSNETEDERVGLSDAQKIEKMKPIELKIAKGVLCMCDQDYSRANQLFHEALHIAQDDNDEEQESMILNLIAANYFECGDYENAEKLFIDLMRRMIANDVPPTAPAILELSLKLASIYSKNLATHEKALKGFKFVINSLIYDLDELLTNIDELDISELSEEKRDMLALLGWSFDWFAKHLLAANDYTSAAEMFQKALQISSKILGPLHDQTLILMNDVGTTLAMNNAPEEGKTFIKKAVEGAITSQSKELASFYVNLGLVNLGLRNLNEAIRYCEYSKELVSKNREHYNFHEVDELSTNCLSEVKRQLETEKQ